EAGAGAEGDESEKEDGGGRVSNSLIRPTHWGVVVFKLLRHLSPKDEIIIVTVAAFGYFVVESIWGALTFEPGAPLFSGPDLKSLVLDELLILAVLAGFLRVRGWTFDLIGLGPDIRETFTGIGLAISVEVLARVLWLFVALSSSHVLDAGQNFNP